MINRISLNPAAIARVLSAITVCLILAHLAGQFSKIELGHGRLLGLVHLFNMEAEGNIPAYFSMLLLLIVTFLVAVIAVLTRKSNLPHVSKWVALSLGFLYMAFDEAFWVHERLIVPVRELMGTSALVERVEGEVMLGVFYFAWVIPGIAVACLLGLVFFKFLLDLPPATRRRFLTAAGLYLGGAIGCELIGGRYAELHGFDNWTYTLISATEETLEIAGLIVFIWALLKYCAESYSEVRFGFAPDAPATSIATDRLGSLERAPEAKT